MKSLLDHSSDRGEGGEKFGVFVNNVLFAVLVVVGLLWFFGYFKP